MHDPEVKGPTWGCHAMIMAWALSNPIGDVLMPSLGDRWLRHVTYNLRQTAHEPDTDAVAGARAGRWTGLDWTGLDWTGLDWTGLDWTGLDWTGLDLTGLDWTGLDWTGYSIGLDWIWTGLDWTGLDWTGLLAGQMAGPVAEPGSGYGCSQSRVQTRSDQRASERVNRKWKGPAYNRWKHLDEATGLKTGAEMSKWNLCFAMTDWMDGTEMPTMRPGSLAASLALN